MDAPHRAPSGRAPHGAAPYLILGGAQLAVGAAGIFARFALGGAGPIAVSAARLSIAALVLAAAAALRGLPQRPTRREGGLLALAGAALALHFGAWIASLEYTSVAVSILLVATTPLWTTLYEVLVRRRPPSRAQLAAFAGGALGLVLVVGLNRTAPPVPGHELLGAGLALGGGAALGIYLLAVREVRSALGTRTIVTSTYGIAALVLVAAAAFAHQAPPSPADAPAWAGILAMAVLSQLIGHTALNAALRWFSPSAVAFATLLEPVSAALLAFLVFGERLTPAAIAGGLLVLAAIGTMLRGEPPMEAP